jgi:hypothetical protein
MWNAIENVSRLVRPNGRLFIAIYNDQGAFSRIWSAVKRMYNRNWALRWPLILLCVPYSFGLRHEYRHLTRRGKVGRGTTFWYDMIGWLGGYPFECARKT